MLGGQPLKPALKTEGDHERTPPLKGWWSPFSLFAIRFSDIRTCAIDCVTKLSMHVSSPRLSLLAKKARTQGMLCEANAMLPTLQSYDLQQVQLELPLE